MKPGKNPRKFFDKSSKRGRYRDENFSQKSKTWDPRLITELHSCIHTHDLAHTLNWHTPVYTGFVYCSLVAISLGWSCFPSHVVFFATLAASFIVVAGVAKYFQVESGGGAVVVPNDPKMRSKHTVESNVKGLFSRIVEPAVSYVAKEMFPPQSPNGGDGKKAEGVEEEKAKPTRLWVIVGLAIVIEFVAEMTRFVSGGVALSLLWTCVFGYTAYRKYTSVPAS